MIISASITSREAAVARTEDDGDCEREGEMRDDVSCAREASVLFSDEALCWSEESDL